MITFGGFIIHKSFKYPRIIHGMDDQYDHDIIDLVLKPIETYGAKLC